MTDKYPTPDSQSPLVPDPLWHSEGNADVNGFWKWVAAVHAARIAEMAAKTEKEEAEASLLPELFGKEEKP